MGPVQRIRLKARMIRCVDKPRRQSVGACRCCSGAVGLHSGWVRAAKCSGDRHDDPMCVSKRRRGSPVVIARSASSRMLRAVIWRIKSVGWRGADDAAEAP